MNVLTKVVTARLEGLGTNSDDIREFFEREGIHGIPEDECNCPIARYLQRAYPEVKIEVDLAEAVFYEPGTYKVLAEVALPSPCRIFAARFDAREFPQLIET